MRAIYFSALHASKKKYILLLFFLLALSMVWAQPKKIDSLLHQLKTRLSYEQKVDALYELSKLYQRINPDSCYSYTQQLGQLAKEHKDRRAFYKAEHMLAFYLSASGKPQEGLTLCEKNIAELKKDSFDMVLLQNFYRAAGVCLMRLNRQQEAVSYFYSALKLAEKLNQSVDVIVTTSNLGWAYMELHQYERAIAEFSKANSLALVNKQKLPSHVLPVLYNNMASCYSSLKKVDSVYKYTRSSLEISLENKDYATAANGLNIIASVLIEEKKYNLALEKLLQAKELRQKIGDPFFIASDMAQLAALYANMSKTKEGIKTAEEALELAKTNKLDAKLPLIYSVLAQNYEAAGNYKEAARLYKNLSNAKDSLFEKANAKALAEMQTQYETEKKESEIKSLKQQEKIKTLELERKNNLLNERNLAMVFILIAFVLLVFLGVFFFRYQNIKNAQKVSQAEESERQRMAKDIHDDLGSGLSKIKFMSEVISSKSKNNPEILSGIKSISNTSIALVDNMRDLIWAMNSENIRLDGLVARIREYSNDYLSETEKKLGINISHDIPTNKINKEAHRNILFIAKEALQNIVKHANADCVEIEIKIEREMFNLKIADNGEGIKGERLGNGLKNMKQRAEIIGANFDIMSGDKGTKIQLSIPLSNLI